MNTEKYSEVIRCRATETLKMKLEAIASIRRLDLSDIAREALWEYIERHSKNKVCEICRCQAN